MKLKIIANSEKDFFDPKFTCDGEDISPAVQWSGIPKDAKSLALFLVDPDAPSKDFVHWIVYNIPPNLNDLQENVTTTRNLPDEVRMGTNDFGVVGYKGPCPPSGTHNYHFILYALDDHLAVDSGLNKTEFRNAIKEHIISETEIILKYKKK